VRICQNETGKLAEKGSLFLGFTQYPRDEINAVFVRLRELGAAKGREKRRIKTRAEKEL